MVQDGAQRLALPTRYDDIIGLNWLKTVSTFKLSGLVMRVWIGSNYRGNRVEWLSFVNKEIKRLWFRNRQEVFCLGQ
jgi:hypothetical protein